MTAERQRLTRSLLDAALRILIPLARVLLRYGIPYGAFEEVAKRAFVQAAKQDFRIPGRKQTVSRVALVTGMTRREVSRWFEDAREPVSDSSLRINRAATIIGSWRRDPRFLDRRGLPASLPFEGGTRSFAELVRRYGNDIPARAALDELERVHAVRRLKDGRLQLIADAYIPGRLQADAVEILGSDVADLIAAIDHNLHCQPGDRFIQRKVAYDNLPAEVLPMLREESARHGQRLLERLDTIMGRADRDTSSADTDGGRHRATVGVYYYEDEVMER